MSPTRTYTVSGMTCDHCRSAIETEVGALDGTETVSADVDSGRVTVVGTVDDELVRRTITDVGYEVGSSD